MQMTPNDLTVLRAAHRVLVREHPEDTTEGPVSLDDWMNLVWDELEYELAQAEGATGRAASQMRMQVELARIGRRLSTRAVPAADGDPAR